jgi:hypothetical protein
MEAYDQVDKKKSGIIGCFIMHHYVYHKRSESRHSSL